MNDAGQYLLRVLRGFVQGEDPGPFSGDWQQLYTLSMMHSVTGILGHSVMSFPHDDNAPIAQMMRRQCLQTMALFSQRGEAMARLTEALSNEGIDHLLFKGYVVREYYTIPELRTFGDIDFLIHPEDRKKCDALMKQWGFESKENWEPVFSYIRGAEFYEIHIPTCWRRTFPNEQTTGNTSRTYGSMRLRRANTPMCSSRNTICFICSRTLQSTSMAPVPEFECIWISRFSSSTLETVWIGIGFEVNLRS